MTPDEWFANLEAALPRRPDPLTAAERQLLLDLARVAAHASERWAAPVSTYLAGLALSGSAADERIELLRQLVATLEPDRD